MRRRVRTGSLFLLALTGVLGGGALAEPQAAAPQGAPPPPQEAAQPASVPVFGVESSLVLLDVVVRDVDGRLVRDLRADELEVYEDGQRQSLSAFDIINKEVTAGGAPGAKAPATSASAPETTTPAATIATPSAGDAAASPVERSALGPVPGRGEPAVIAFVFDRLSAEGRHWADRAAHVYLEREYAPGDVVGVFVIDSTVRTLLPFSTELKQIRKAFDRAAMHAPTPHTGSRAEARQATKRATEIERELTALGTSATSATSRLRAAALGVQLSGARALARTNRSVDRIERDQEGFSCTDGLLAVVSGLKALPGRKTIVLISEGLPISGNVQPQFESLIAVANRANVSVYALDAGGLRVEGETHEAQAELAQLAAARLQTGGAAEDGGALLQGIQNAEEMLALNPHVKLGELAEGTGGFLVRDTNDPSDGLSRLQEEMRFYYLLSYAPTRSEFDGTFRSISVTVKRPGVKVRARKGYLALPPVPRPPAPQQSTAP